MSTADQRGAWPFPGLVWGDYPQRALPLDNKPRRGKLTTAQLEVFAKEATGSNFAQTGDDAVSTALMKACAAMVDAIGITPRWQQVMAARALLEQKLVEMDTGEGKTYAIALAAAAAALAGSPVHIVTSNDYLAARDAGELAPFYARLGLRSGSVVEAMTQPQRAQAYASNVTYVTGKELAFDFLRDAIGESASGSDLQQRAQRGKPSERAEPRVLRGLCFAILDEADTLLIDEARVPLVLAQAQSAQGEAAFHQAAWSLSRGMVEGTHFRISADSAQVRLLPEGRAALAQWPSDGTQGDALHDHPAHRENAVVLALNAAHLLREGRDYVLRDGAVALVDGSTGRLSQGRAWSRGLHQLVELKEGVAATGRNETLAQITFQRFFARYLRLAGISGTLREAKPELARVYGLAQLRIEPHEPRRVRDDGIRLFADSATLWRAVAEQADALSKLGRPVLAGVNTVAQSQALSHALTRAGVDHQLLNATHDDAEQLVLSRAGQAGVVTVATSMAGRGSDIRLDSMALQAGGLHVVLCQLNASARIDRQFLGRAGRQGQPGSTEKWLAADFDALAGVPLALKIYWQRRSFVSVKTLILYLNLVQGVRTYMTMKQRVTLLRSAEAEERDYAFSRNLLV